MSNGSFGNLGSNHIFTCDNSDTLISDPDLQDEPYKIYLGSKASFLIHPFSQVANCNSHINNTKNIFKLKKPSRVPIDASSSLNQTFISKI